MDLSASWHQEVSHNSRAMSQRGGRRNGRGRGRGYGPGPHGVLRQLAPAPCGPGTRPCIGGTGGTIFAKIIRREAPATILYEDNECIAFEDIAPQAPVHFVVVPKKPIPSLSAAEDDDDWLLGHLLITARRLAREYGLSNGYRIVINNGPNGCQTVYHLHLHVVGGRRLRWPPC